MGRKSARSESRTTLPVIHLVGLPGAGKSTIASRLAKHLALPVFRIGKFRANYPSSESGEANGWVDLFIELGRVGWRNAIVESTGLNRRSCFLRAAIEHPALVTVKLVCPQAILLKRIAAKRDDASDCYWVFRGIAGKQDFARSQRESIKALPAELTVDTAKTPPAGAVARILRYIDALDEPSSSENQEGASR